MVHPTIMHCGQWADEARVKISTNINTNIDTNINTNTNTNINTNTNTNTNHFFISFFNMAHCHYTFEMEGVLG